MSMPTAIHWLTRDFRLGDNPALAAAARGPMRSVFFIDAQLLAQGAASRWRLERALRISTPRCASVAMRA